MPKLNTSISKQTQQPIAKKVEVAGTLKEVVEDFASDILEQAVEKSKENRPTFEACFVALEDEFRKKNNHSMAASIKSALKQIENDTVFFTFDSLWASENFEPVKPDAISFIRRFMENPAVQLQYSFNEDLKVEKKPYTDQEILESMGASNPLVFDFIQKLKMKK